MYKSRIEIFNGILSPMLSCFGNKEYKVTFWNKTQGYGLKANDFEKQVNCSRRVFSHWKNYLLEQKLIKIPWIKRKQKKDDGTFRSSHNIPFVITPLGICYFSSILDGINLEYGEKIVKFLSQYSSYNLYSDWKKICEIIGNEKVLSILKKVCDSVDITEIKDKTIVNLNYKTKGRINYELFKYTIKDKKIILQWSEEGFTNIDDELFHEELAYFILESFCYSIIEECNYKIHEKSKLGYLENRTTEEKLNIKKPIKKWQKILEVIPFEMHLIANNFIDQHVFGTLKQEQKLAGEISDYFYSKIAPKYGYEFTDTKGKPMQLFPD